MCIRDRACVETVSDDMTRAWIEFKREGESGDDALLTDLAQACKRLGLQLSLIHI